MRCIRAALFFAVAVQAAWGASLRWDSTSSTAWDLATSGNWYDTVSLTGGQLFHDGDAVAFDDTAGVTNLVEIAGAVAPASITVTTDTNSFTLAGSGKIAGLTGIVKTGTNVLTLAATGGNDFTGPVLVSGGVVRVGALGAFGATTGITVSAGGQVELNGVQQAVQKSFTVSGAGPDGLGAIVNSGVAVYGNSAVTFLTLADDATLGAVGPGTTDAGRWDIGIGGGLLQANGHTLTKVGAGAIVFRCPSDNLTNLVVLEGFAVCEDADASLGSNVSVAAGARVGAYNGRTVPTRVQLNGGTLSAWGGAASRWTGPIEMTADSFVDTEPRVGAYGAADIFVDGSVSGPAGLTKRGGQTLFLNGSNSYSGATVIENGGGRIVVSNATGRSLLGAVAIGHGVNNAGTARLDVLTSDVIDPLSDVSFNGEFGDWAYLVLFGTRQTVASLFGMTGAGVIENVESEGGFDTDCTLVVASDYDSQYNGYLRDKSSGSSLGRVVLVKEGPAELTLGSGFISTYSGGLTVSNGTVNLKSRYAAGTAPIVLAGGNLALDGIGLQEGEFGGGAINTDSPNSLRTTQLTTPRANTALDFNGNTTWAYTGYIVNTDTVSRTFTFAENVDDVTWLKIDDKVVLNDGGWNSPTIGNIILTPGLHRFDLRVWNGGGPGGPNASGWWSNTGLGVGWDLQGRGQAVMTNYEAIADSGNGALLQTDVVVTNPVVLKASASLRVSSAVGPTNSITGEISEDGGSRSITKIGAGALALNGVTTYTGPTTVEAGTLLVNGSLATESVVTVKSGAILGGRGSAGAVSVQTLGGIIGGSGGGPEETLTLSSLALGAGASSTTTVYITQGLTTNIVVVSGAGGFSVSGTIVIHVAGSGFGPATYDLIRYSGSLGGSISNFRLGSVPVELAGVSLQDSGSAIQLVVTSAGTPVWVGQPADSWDLAGTTNWRTSVTATPTSFDNGEPVIFDDTASNFTVNLAAQVGPSSLLVNVETNDYLFSGSGGITGAISFVKTGAGGVTISSTNSFTGPMVISGGTVRVASILDGGAPSPLGASSSAAENLYINGPTATLEYTGPSASINRMFTVGPSGGVINVATTGSLLTINGTGWNINGTLRKRGPGELHLVNYYFSYANAGTDIVVEEGKVSFDNDYWWHYPWEGATRGWMRIVVTGGSTLALPYNASFGFLVYPNNSSLEQIVVEEDSICTLGSNGAVYDGSYGSDGRYLVRGGTINGGGQMYSMYGFKVSSAASAVSGYIGVGWSTYFDGQTYSLDVADGAADPDLVMDGGISGNGATFHRTGDGRWLMRNTINSGAINLMGGITQIGDATREGSLGGAGTVSNAGILAFGQSVTATVLKAIAGPGTFVQLGTGTTVLAAANLYDGPTYVSNGTLLVNGSLSTGFVYVASGGTLGGTGTVAGSVVCSGSLAPGASVGAFIIGGTLEMIPGASLRLELGGSAQGTEYDYILAIGDVTLGGNLDVGFINGFEASVTPGEEFVVLESLAPIGGVFDNVAPGGTLTVAGQSFKVYYGADPGPYSPNQVTLVAVTADADSDGDGLTDGEEAGYGTDPGLFDSDGDGMGDGDEVVAGSNPLNADSIGYRIIQEKKVGGAVVILWSSVTNRSYVVLSSTNLVGPQTWTPAATVPTGGATTGYTNAAPGAAGLYQIRGQVAP
jgi:fibronectin-binding autotransporter adhesin